MIDRDGPARNLDRLPRRPVADMGQVDEDAEAVHVRDHLAAKAGEAEGIHARLIENAGFDFVSWGHHWLIDPFQHYAGRHASVPRVPGVVAVVTGALLAQHKAGVTHATMRVSWPGMRQDDILAGIDLLGREVLPEVRRRTSAGRG